MDQNNALLLRYESVVVGIIDDAFESDCTWFGVFSPTIKPDCTLHERLLEFINFSKDWNERERDNPIPPDTVEWDRFRDLISSGLWQIVDSHDVVTSVAESPVFFEGGDITWAIRP